MAVSSAQKTFYIETFGCQMNFHDSEKVVGTLISEGYAQVRARGGGRPHPLQHLLDSRQGRAEGLSPAQRFQEAAQGREALCRARLRRPAGGREDLRARAACVAGGGFGLVPQPARDAGADRVRRESRHRTRRPPDRPDLRDRVHRPHQSASGIHHHHRRLRQVLRLLRGAVHPRQGAQPHVALGAGRSPAHGRQRLTRRFNCSGKT